MSALAEIQVPLAVRFNPDARAFEAFRLGETGTCLLDPLAAVSLEEAYAETTARWSWDRGDRLAIREIGERVDLLHIHAVRRKSQGVRAWQGYNPVTEYRRWLDHICTIDLNIVAGIDVVGVGVERDLFERRQAKRPEGARR